MTSKNLQNRIIPLSKREKTRDGVRSPFAKLNNIQWLSWRDDYLPNTLWACLLAGQLDREHYLSIFRDIVYHSRAHLESNMGSTLCHNYISTVTLSQFTEIFQPIINDSTALSVVSQLRLITSIPDFTYWESISVQISDSEAAWSGVARSVFMCMDHQSEQATDVRWFKVLSLILAGRLKFPEEMREHVEDIIRYPNRGDLRRVRPSVRSLEMSLRNFEFGPEKPKSTPDFPVAAFWQELLDKTGCARPKRVEIDPDVNLEISKEIETIIRKIVIHFFDSVETSGVDARLDSSFGIALYIITILLEISVLPSNRLASGRILLRTIVECYITLKYLSSKDDPSIWLQFRNYGSGQTALAFLKNMNFDEAPDFMSIEAIESIANEDSWMESKDILIGNWAKLNLRKMAEESGTKEIYDKYYDWTSGFSHGHWGAVRASVFETCLNPLHRLHRIPLLLSPHKSVLKDCCKIANLAIEEINYLYPSFKPRIKWAARPNG